MVAFGMLYISFTIIKSYPQYLQSVLLNKGDSKVPRLDIAGWLLLIVAVTIPLIALTLGDNYLPWTHPVEILLLISGPILIGCFVFFEARIATDPVINMTPVFEVEYLKVLLQVFGVISTFNMVTQPSYILMISID